MDAGSRGGENLLAGESGDILRGDGIKARERGLVIHFRLAGIGKAGRDGGAECGIASVHDGEAGKVSSDSGGFSGEHVDIGLRPVEPKDASDDANQAIFEVWLLRRALQAIPVEHDQAMNNVRVSAEAVKAAEGRVAEAGRRTASALPEQSVGHR